MITMIDNPHRSQWAALCRRPTMSLADIAAQVQPIVAAVRAEGDAAVRRYTRQFDGIDLPQPEVPAAAVAAARVDASLAAAIDVAIANIEAFHRAQAETPAAIDTMPGVTCWRRSVPIQRVGLYIPGGTSPLFSTVLMLGIPAKIAGCPQVVLCTPPDEAGEVHPAILYAARRVGVHRIFRVGGAQAIAAMAYGSEQIPRVDKIFGPGNQYVTAAKQLVSGDGPAIDMPAGPSELAVIADWQANARFVAADLLSQAEHGADSQVLLLTDSPELAAAVQQALQAQLPELPRKAIAAQALQHSRIILLPSLDAAIEFSNLYAPEHLIINTADAADLAARVTDAGSVFLGRYAPESVGDYASGTNHTLPTNGHARAYSGVSLDSFVKKITFQSLSAAGLQAIGAHVECLAAAEGLAAHRRAVSIRLEEIGGDR